MEGEDVVVEVAPAELAAKRVGSLAARQALLDLARSDAAEVEVGGEARGAVLAERVVDLRVLAHRAVEEAVECLVRLRLAADGWLFDLLGQAERLEARQPALRELRRKRRHLARRIEHVAALDAEPVLVEGAEDGVGLSLLGADVAELIDRVQAGMVDCLDSRPSRTPRGRASRARGRMG